MKPDRDFLRRHFLPYCRWVNPSFLFPEHIYRLGEVLERVERGELTRVVIEMPPRHGKSVATTIHFPTWYIGKHPDHKLAITSYSSELAGEFATQSRALIDSPRYAHVFPDVRTEARRTGGTMWDIEGTGGGVKSIGVGGAMTGRGFHGIIVDDPIKNDMEARSPVFRERTWRWFNSTAYTRLEPDGWCIVIMTRWHDDDIVGRLLREQEEQGVNTWEVVNLPAIATASNTNPYEWREEGEPLWGERFSIGDLRRIEKQIGAYQFTALYQQRPVPEGDGDLNHTDLRMIRREALPPMVRLCRYWDLAFSEKAAADSIAGVLCGIDAQNNFYILHIEPLKMRWTRGMPRLMDRALLDPPLTRQIIESNGTQLGYYQEVKEHTRMRRTHVSNCNPVGTKEMRAGVWGSRLVDGIIFCVVDEWNDALFQQMDGFPNAAHDDMVDGVSGAWWHLMVGKGGAVHSAQ